MRDSEFWSHVRKRSSGCWEWTAATTNRGYGNLLSNGRNVSAHRKAWELTYGRIPAGMCVLHLCDNRCCVNPSHLRLGTVRDNNRDCAAKGRQFHVPSHLKARGSDHGIAKLNEAQVAEILRAYRNGTMTQKELARRYGVCKQTVCNIVHRRIWRHVEVPAHA